MSAVLRGKMVGLDRGYVEVSGPQAEDFLERMLTNEVVSLAPEEARSALLLTPKGRIIAPLRIIRTAPEGFVLITDVSVLAAPVAEALRAARFATRCEIETRSWSGFVQFGAEAPPPPAFPIADFGVDAWEGWREEGPEERGDPDSLEALRIEAGTPAWGKELDDSILPAEAGLDETHVSFTKGCFPGQEPVARLHYRGHANRRLRRLSVGSARPGDGIVWEERVVGRVTSAVPGTALGYVRTNVPDDASLTIGGAEARLH
jgi:tRNA-modifying protein YgfZ